MPRRIIALLVVLACARSAPAASPSSADFNWDLWRSLPVQDGGRYKPLDSQARETCQMIIGRSTLTDPDSGQKLGPVALYMTMVLDWQGWAAAGPQASYFGAHKSDRWDRSALIFIDSLELRNALGMPKDKRYISPDDLLASRLKDPATGNDTSFPEWADGLVQSKRKNLSALEKRGSEVAERLWIYRDMRMGHRLVVLPIPHGRDQEWVSLGDLVAGNRTGALDKELVARLKDEFLKVYKAYAAGDAAQFNAASATFVDDLQRTGPQQGTYPAERIINLEVAYNAWTPFRFAWTLAMLACLGTLLSMGTPWRPVYWLSMALSAASLAAMLIGFGLRVAISGRAPVTNMYESIVYVGCGITFFGLLFELIYRRQYILVASSAVGTLALVLADVAPTLLDPSLQPLQPVLRSNYWLVIHVMTITLSYAAFALALGISNITLGFYLVGSTNRNAVAALSTFTYRCLQVGVLLLAAGTILGGVWAAYSWGRFWGWDPKEVWALIALLGYLAVLHSRYIGWVANLGLAAASVICFTLVVMAWYGVNFVLGAGLHSYGFGAGGQGSVYAVLGVQWVYVLAAVLRGALASDTSGLNGPSSEPQSRSQLAAGQPVS